MRQTNLKSPISNEERPCWNLIYLINRLKLAWNPKTVVKDHLRSRRFVEYWIGMRKRNYE